VSGFGNQLDSFVNGTTAAKTVQDWPVEKECASPVHGAAWDSTDQGAKFETGTFARRNARTRLRDTTVVITAPTCMVIQQGTIVD
jgi:hypothetical protein